jgi:hypothetical protein
MSKYVWIVIIVALVLLGAYFSFKRTSTNQNQQANIQSTFFPIATPSILPSSSPSPVPTKSKTTQTNSDITGGQIACNYQVPAAPNQFGTVAIKSSWTNANMNLCVSINGGSPALISQDKVISGTRTDTPNWIALDTDYTFTLYNQHAGGAACTGDALSNCQISSHVPHASPLVK